MTELLVSRALDLGIVVVLTWSFVAIFRGQPMPQGAGLALIAAVGVQVADKIFA